MSGGLVLFFISIQSHLKRRQIRCAGFVFVFLWSNKEVFECMLEACVFLVFYRRKLKCSFLWQFL